MMVQFAHPDAVIGTMAITADDLRKLKAMISSKAKNASFHCSEIVATYAYAWVSYIKARAPSAESIVHLVFAGNCRGRLQPTLPAEYFDNCIITIFYEAKAGDLAGEDGVVVAIRIASEGIE
ncbi:hypothetical protein ZIOFF_018745 [Zingiber officinale]|uniref:Uncharacterized protein n=1 Tax=Zingiber officinale TaxID=94328 RepID=A0A8J5HDB1_ZINOF|nr:hypothetical protein ZIOFF_018745 [Zingiber officinale]